MKKLMLLIQFNKPSTKIKTTPINNNNSEFNIILFLKMSLKQKLDKVISMNMIYIMEITMELQEN